jgi:ribose 5-phosphate isomerase B
MDKALVDRIVAEVMRRLGVNAPAKRNEHALPVRLVTEEMVGDTGRQGGRQILVTADAIVTPLGADALRRSGIALITEQPGSSLTKPASAAIAIGADRRGEVLMDLAKRVLTGREVVDIGRSDGFVEIARDVAKAVASQRFTMGIILGCGGDASAMVANKIHGVRAVSCHDATSAKYARAHLDANVLCIGVGVVGDTTAQEIIETWMETPFDEGAYGPQIDRIRQIEDEAPDG